MILHLLPKDVGGCEYHRIEIPMHKLTGFELAQSTILDGVKDEDLKKISLIVFSRDGCIVDVEGQIARLKKMGIPYVIDIDDYWKLNKEHIFYKEFKDVHAARWIALMKSAAAVTTTIPRLAGKIANHNKNVVVVPNALDVSQPQWQYPGKTLKENFYGWVGSESHLQDIEMLIPAFEKMHRENVINLALGGFRLLNEISQLFDKWMSGYGHYKKYKRILGADVYNYGNIYNGIDACLVPLIESEFSACKSPLKLIEAGFKGRPCIVSRVAPYTDNFTDKEVLFVDNKYEWYSTVMKLHNNENMFIDYREALKEGVQEFEIQKVNYIREQLYTSIINGK